MYFLFYHIFSLPIFSFVFSFLSTNFKWIRINLPFSFKNSEASISKRRFQQLDLSGSYQSISANYSTNAKRILKKSLGFSMKKCEDIEIFTNQAINRINISLEKFRYNVIIAVFHEIYSFYKKIYSYITQNKYIILKNDRIRNNRRSRKRT